MDDPCPRKCGLIRSLPGCRHETKKVGVDTSVACGFHVTFCLGFKGLMKSCNTQATLIQCHLRPLLYSMWPFFVPLFYHLFTVRTEIDCFENMAKRTVFS